MIRLAPILLSIFSVSAAWTEPIPEEDATIKSPHILGVRIYADKPSPTLVFQWIHVPGAVAYRFWREVWVTRRLDDDLINLNEPIAEFVPWSKIDVSGHLDDAPSDNTTISAPGKPLDNVVTRWALSAEIERDGTLYRSPLRIFDLPAPPFPTAVSTKSWGQIKSGR